MAIREASISDADKLAQLINMAGEGLPEYLWRDEAAACNLTPVQLGARRAAREDGAFSYRNARVAELDGTVAGMLLGYRLVHSGEDAGLDSLPACVRPLVELEALAPGSWYVNAVAAFPECRGRGVGQSLMAVCEDLARADGADKLSLIVASENTGAHRLYQRLAYKDIAVRPLVSWPGGPEGGNWILMIKALSC